jgi:hypothetical protein
MSRTDKPPGEVVEAADKGLPAELAADARWEMVMRIVSGSQFRKSPRLRRFLLFVAERTLTGHAEDVNEHTIGWKVFERGIDYNPSDDSIVRTTARQLRTKIKEYFETEGSEEAWTLEIPKGSYVPVFARKDEDGIAVVKQLLVPSAAPSSVRMWQGIAAASAVVAIGSLAAVFWVSSRPGAGSPQSSAPTIVSTVLTPGPQPTRLVVGDFGAVMMALSSKRFFSLQEYADHSYAKASPEPNNAVVSYLWNILGGGQVVSLPDVRISGTILRSGWEAGRSVVVQHARQLTARDLRSGNSILLTSTVGNPWMQMFEDKLNFRFRLQFYPDAPGGISGYENMRPLPGEKATYAGSQSAPQFGLAYGLVARIPNLTGTGKVLLICGQKFTGLEAAGEYATDSKSAADLAKLLSVRDIRDAPDFEVLIETQSIDTTPRYVRAIAFRRIGS